MAEWIGFIAAGLVLATFSMDSMRPLRLTALASNVAFITYAFLEGLTPVLVLHTLLLPMNLLRLMQLSVNTASTSIAAEEKPPRTPPVGSNGDRTRKLFAHQGVSLALGIGAAALFIVLISGVTLTSGSSGTRLTGIGNEYAAERLSCTYRAPSGIVVDPYCFHR